MRKLGGLGKNKQKAGPVVDETAPVTQKTRTKEPMEPLHKIAFGVIAASAVCLIVLLNSGVTEKLVEAKSRELPVPSTAVVDNGSRDTDETAKPDDTKRADDADITTGDGFDPDVDRDASTKESDKDAPLDLRDNVIRIAPGAVVDKETLTKHLSQMKPEAFLALVASVDRVISETPAGEKGGRQQTLEEAYLKAEQKFGSKVDASKRLTLVDELNAIDYKYYVAEKGDTLLYLSQAFGVPLGQLMELNGIGDADKINAGMILLFPLETKQP